MMSDRKCNGWANYETWNVKLWLDNDEGTQADMERIVKHARKPMEAEDALRDYVRDMMPDLAPSMFSDILSAAMSEVDWREIVASIREDQGGCDESR